MVYLVVPTALLDQLQGSHLTFGLVGSLQLIQLGSSDNQIDHSHVLGLRTDIFFWLQFWKLSAHSRVACKIFLSVQGEGYENVYHHGTIQPSPPAIIVDISLNMFTCIWYVKWDIIKSMSWSWFIMFIATFQRFWQISHVLDQTLPVYEWRLVLNRMWVFMFSSKSNCLPLHSPPPPWAKYWHVHKTKQLLRKCINHKFMFPMFSWYCWVMEE